jgi:hypothetical protein
MKPTLVRARPRGSRAAAVLLLPLALLPLGCESDSVFEGEPVVAPPVAEFDQEATAATAIHGGVLAVGVTARDPYVGVDSLVVRYSGALQVVYPATRGSKRSGGHCSRSFGTQGVLLSVCLNATAHAGVDSVYDGRQDDPAWVTW